MIIIIMIIIIIPSAAKQTLLSLRMVSPWEG
jgi:hypothetical protein